MNKTGFILPFGLGAIIALALVGGAIVAAPLLSKQQSFLCGGVVGHPTSFQGQGFATSGGTGWLGGMQFVIRPNSTGSLTVTYIIANNSENITAQTIYANWTSYFRPVEYWYKLGPNTALLNASRVGMNAYPVNASANGKNILSSTYEISALANAQEGAYYTTWFSTCGPQIVITIGYTLYAGPGLADGKYL